MIEVPIPTRDEVLDEMRDAVAAQRALLDGAKTGIGSSEQFRFDALQAIFENCRAIVGLLDGRKP